MTQFIIAYEHGGHTYTCKVDAHTFADAQRHLIAIASTGRVSGEHVMDVPVQEPLVWIDITDEGQITSSPRLYQDGSREERPLYTTPPDDTALLRQALEALILAQSAIEDWGRYASEYFQKKHDLEGDVAGPAKTISALRVRLGEKTWPTN